MPGNRKRKLSTRSSNCSGTNTTASHSFPRRTSPKAQREWKKLSDKEQQLAIDNIESILFPPDERQLPPPCRQLFIEQSFPERIHLLMMNTENRVSPQAPEIEEAILGACLIEQEAMPLVADKLRPEMFYVLRHQIIYAAMLAMYQAGTKIDILTVKEELSHRGKLEEAGGPYGITQLSSKVASSAHRIPHPDCARKIPAARNDPGLQQTSRLFAGRNHGYRRLADRCTQPARPPGG